MLECKGSTFSSCRYCAQAVVSLGEGFRDPQNSGGGGGVTTFKLREALHFIMLKQVDF